MYSIAEWVVIFELLRGGFFVCKNIKSTKKPIVIDSYTRELLKNIKKFEAKDLKLVDFLCEQHILLKKGQKLEIIFEEPDWIEVWLHVTNRCNLRCGYCYVYKDSSDMDWITLKYSIVQIFKSALKNNKKSVKIKYAWGEPLLVFENIIRANNLAQEFSKKTGIKFESRILTNATLLSEKIAKEISDNSIDLMISIDGIQEYNDTQRVYINGKGSYNKIILWIDIAIKYNVIPDISITVSQANLKDLHLLLEILIEKKLPFQLNFTRETECEQADTDKITLYNSDKAFIDALKKLYNYLEGNFPDFSLLNSLSDRALVWELRNRPCGAGINYLIIDHNGKLSKCQMKMSESVWKIWDGDILEVIHNSNIWIKNLKVDDKVDCKSCEWKYICAGGCPVATKEYRWEYNKSSPFCFVYKAIFPEILKLEGLRILKKNGINF